LRRTARDVLLPLPLAWCVLTSFQFQAYGDVKALGQARKALEEAVAVELVQQALVYETHVVPQRSGTSNRSVAWGQRLFVLAVVTAAMVGDYAAFALDGWRVGVPISLWQCSRRHWPPSPSKNKNTSEIARWC
jgi:hypothetical protein